MPDETTTPTPPFVVLGATGHIGSAVAGALLDRGADVTVVTRDPAKGRTWSDRGARVAVADLLDPEALGAAMPRGGRLFALNPPAPVTGDTDAAENATADAIADAVRGAGLDRVVALSTYGAQEGEQIGDLGTLFRFERVLADATAGTTTEVCVVRAAYLYSNWDGLVPLVREQGRLPTMSDPAVRIPTVDPADVGRAAAELLLASEPGPPVTDVEGPEELSPDDVAGLFAAALDRPVQVDVTPRDAWVSSFEQLGFSPEAARSYAGMVAISVDGGFDRPAHPTRGASALRDYLGALVARPDPGHATSS